jgi:hypothetical protein
MSVNIVEERVQIACECFVDHNPSIPTIERDLFNMVFDDEMSIVAFDSGYAKLRSDGRIDLVKKITSPDGGVIVGSKENEIAAIAGSEA